MGVKMSKKELKEKLEAAGSIKMVLLWRKIYNSVCAKCQNKIHTTAIKNKRRSPENYLNAVDFFCKDCTDKVNKIIEGAK